MPWQRQAADVALEVLEDGTPAYREVGISVPRQNGKTQLILSVEVDRCVLWEPAPQRVAYSSQTGQDAEKKLIEDQYPMLERSNMRHAVERLYKTPGKASILFRNGSRIQMTASGEAAGHGRTIDLAVLDELWADPDFRREQSLIPAMATRPQAQLWWVSTAGDDGSVMLNTKMDTGRSSVLEDRRSGICYLEWSAPDDADIEDPRVWRACMPAFGITIDERVVRAAYETMSEGEFRRAFLNQRMISSERVIAAHLWNAISRPDVELSEGVTFALDVSADRAHAAIVAVDNERRAEVVEYGWLSGMGKRAAELCERWAAPIAIDEGGPAATIAGDLELAGANVVRYSTSTLAAACARLFDSIAEGSLSVRFHPALEQAVAGVKKRTVGDRWIWARRDTSVDICPLVALTLALDCSVTQAQEGATTWAMW